MGARMLGKQRAVHDPRTLRLEKYLPDEIAIPAAVDWSDGHEDFWWGPLGNDAFGDCTCAAACHMTDAWRIAHNQPPTCVTDDALSAYAAVTGFDPDRPETDRGAVVLDVLNYWRQHGIAGSKIDAYAAVKVRLIPHTVDLFGGAYLGLQLPLSAQGQKVWSKADGPDGLPGTWGGHAVSVISYDPQGVVLVTWGERQRATWDFIHAYCDEAYAVLSGLWAQSGPAPGGLDIAQLRADLARVTA